MGKFTRPADVPFPSVWREFKAKDSDSDELVNYRIQDCTEDRFEDAIQHMVEHFLRDENTCKCRELLKYPKAIDEAIALWRETIQQKVTIVCFKEGSDEIVGVNMVLITTNKDPLPELCERPLDDIWSTIVLVKKSVDVFKKYNVDKYMSAYGLSVLPSYRGRGIGEHFMKARVPLCKAIDIPVTSIVLTSIGSQIPAERTGFQLDYEITYEDLEKKHGYVYPGNTVRAIKLMSMRID